MTDTGEEEHRRLVPRVPGQRPTERASPAAYTTVLVGVIVFVYLIKTILLPFIVAGAIAYVLTPLVNRIQARSHLPRWAVAALTYVVLLALLAGACLLIVPPLIQEVKETVTHLPETIHRALAGVLGNGPVTFMGQKTDVGHLSDQALTALRQSVAQASIIERFALGGFAGAFGVILTIVLLFYFLSGGPTIARGLIWLVPPKQRPLVEAMWRQVDPILVRYFGGVIIVVIYATGAAYLGLGLALHLPNAVVLAVLTGFLEMIPVVGPAASAVIAGLSALRAATGIGPVVGYVIYATALRISIDQLIGPLVLGRAGRVHPVLIIFCFLIGGALFGIPGVVLAIPVALTVKTVLATLYEEPLDDNDH